MNLIVVTAVVKISTFISAQNVNVWIRITYFSDGTKEFVKSQHSNSIMLLFEDIFFQFSTFINSKLSVDIVIIVVIQDFVLPERK